MDADSKEKDTHTVWNDMKLSNWWLWRVGRGPRAVGTERGRWSNGNERHLHHSPVSIPTEELRKGLNEEWQPWKTGEDQAWILVLCFVCGSRPWGAAAFHLYLLFDYLKLLMFAGSRLLLPHIY